MSIAQKQAIIQLYNEKNSSSKIRKILGINRFTVLKFLKRFKESDSVENQHRSGRPRKTSA